MKRLDLNKNTTTTITSPDSTPGVRLIFLDLDGVLNTERHITRLQLDHKPYSDHYGPLFDPEAINNLRKIIDDTGAKIVITSSWRYIHGLDGLRKMWAERNMPGTIHGVTPTDSFGNRGDEVKEYLSKISHNTHINYLILDDECEYSGILMEHLITTKAQIGITSQTTSKAIEILTAKIPH